MPDVILSARVWLNEAQPIDDVQKILKERLLAYAEEGFSCRGDAAGWASCVQAFVAIANNQYGIGALLLDDASHVVAAGHNEISGPPFRSEAHAEMVVLSDFERRFPDRRKDGLTLYTSLEPCPMCYTRILMSGVPRVFYVAEDATGGMARCAERMPDYWRAMTGRCAFARAPAREGLAQLSLDILTSNMAALEQSVKLSPFVGS